MRGKGNATTPSPTKGIGWLPIAISSVALAVSVWTLYITQLAAFSPLITVGNIVWHPASEPLPTGPGVFGAAGPHGHLHRYCDEFAFRYELRKVDDGTRAAMMVEGAEGKRLTYKQPVAS